MNTVNEWAKGWEARGWRRKGGPIKNLELVQELYALAQARPGVTLHWIRAHDGSRWNEYVDALATSYVREDSSGVAFPVQAFVHRAPGRTPVAAGGPTDGQQRTARRAP